MSFSSSLVWLCSHNCIVINRIRSCLFHCTQTISSEYEWHFNSDLIRCLTVSTRADHFRWWIQKEVPVNRKLMENVSKTFFFFIIAIDRSVRSLIEDVWSRNMASVFIILSVLILSFVFNGDCDLRPLFFCLSDWWLCAYFVSFFASLSNDKFFVISHPHYPLRVPIDRQREHTRRAPKGMQY